MSRCDNSEPVPMVKVEILTDFFDVYGLKSLKTPVVSIESNKSRRDLIRHQPPTTNH